jgi:hypothetical protein
MRVNPDGPGLLLCEWPWSITAMTNTRKITRGSREDAKRHIVVTSGNTVLSSSLRAACLELSGMINLEGSIVFHTPLKRCQKNRRAGIDGDARRSERVNALL